MSKPIHPFAISPKVIFEIHQDDPSEISTEAPPFFFSKFQNDYFLISLQIFFIHSAVPFRGPQKSSCFGSSKSFFVLFSGTYSVIHSIISHDVLCSYWSLFYCWNCLPLLQFSYILIISLLVCSGNPPAETHRSKTVI